MAMGRFGHVKNLWAVLVLGRFGIDPSGGVWVPCGICDLYSFL